MKSDLYGPASRVAVVHPVRAQARDMGEALLRAGHRVKIVLPGPDALEEVRAHRADLVVAHVSFAQDLDPTAELGLPLISLAEGGTRGDQLTADAMLREPVDPESLRICVGGLLRLAHERRQLRRRVSDLSALYRLSWALSLEGGAKSLYGYIAKHAAEMLGATKGLVLLYDPESRRMTAQPEGFGVPADALQGLSYPVDGDASRRWNFRKNGPLSSTDAETDARLLPDAVARLGVRSLALVPMTSGHRTVGLLGVADRPDGVAFGEEDTSLLLAAASLAAVASENLKVHERVKKANERYEEYDRLKSQFVGMVAHDFRRPLTVIRGFAELVLVDEPPDATVKDYMRGIIEECEGLARLADDTLLLAKLETASVEFRWAETDIGALLHEVVPPALAGHTVLVDLPPKLPSVVVDAQRLRQVLSNLVSNAIKYSPRGGLVTLRCRVDDEVKIDVSDQGLGIPKAQQGQLFNKFERVQTEEHQAVSGTGLGLYICRLIVQGHGGRIWVESEPGEGSTFCVRLPRDARPGRGGRAPVSEKSAADGPITSMFRPSKDLPEEYRTDSPLRGPQPAREGASAASSGAASVADRMPDDSQTALYRRAELRRSRRIRRMIPIRLNYQGAMLTTYTAVINRRGALIICAAPIDAGTTLQITNLVTQRTEAFEVVRRGDEEEGQYKLGVELIEDVDFWGASYDPEIDEDFGNPQDPG